MKIAIFGGAFNPIHRGHLSVAEGATKQLGLDQVLFVPTGNPVHRPDSELAAGTHRAAMIRCAIENEPAYALSTIELDRQGPSYMIDTILQLKAEAEAGELYLLIGEDNLQVPWQSWDRILDAVRVVVYPRSGASPPPSRDSGILRLDLPMLDYAASTIRDKRARGESIAQYVPPCVASYIDAHHLYE